MGQDTQQPDPGTNWFAEPHSCSQTSVEKNELAAKKKNKPPKQDKKSAILFLLLKLITKESVLTITDLNLCVNKI